MNHSEITRLPLCGKFQIMADTRAGLGGQLEPIQMQPEHLELLDARRARVAAGVLVTLLMIFDVTQGQPASPSAGAPGIVKRDPARAFIQNKLNTIIIPRIDFEDVTVEEAIDFLRLRAVELDVSEKDPAKRGINFVIRNPRPAAATAGPAPTIRRLRLKNVPLAMMLKYVCDQTNRHYTVDETAIVISPKNEAGAEAAVPVDARKKAAIQNKLKSIILPSIDLENATVDDTIDFLRLRAAELDVTENDPAKKGIQWIVRYPAAGPTPVIRELRLKKVPLADVLKYVCDQTNFRYTVDDFAVTLAPKDPAGAEPAKPAEK